MTPYKKRVTAFTKRMAEDMQLRNLSPSPIDWLPVRQCPRWIDPNSRDESNPGAA